ncbi:MAG: hypothetical protein ACOVQX_03860 [Legionella sp.]
MSLLMSKTIGYWLLSTSIVWANAPELTIKCKGLSEPIVISGCPRGEGYDLSIKMNNYSLHYVNKCSDIHCLKRRLNGNIYVIDAVQQGVFSIFFSDHSPKNNASNGYMYAIPKTIQYVKMADGYHATFEAIYSGTDLSSNNHPKKMVNTPIKLICNQRQIINEL